MKCQNLSPSHVCQAIFFSLLSLFPTPDPFPFSPFPSPSTLPGMPKSNMGPSLLSCLWDCQSCLGLFSTLTPFSGLVLISFPSFLSLSLSCCLVAAVLASQLSLTLHLISPSLSFLICQSFPSQPTCHHWQSLLLQGG